MSGLSAPQTPPRWFKLAAIAAILWNALGCFSYLVMVTVDPATLTPAQRADYEQWPTSEYALHAIAVWVGIVGAVLLFVRRRPAVPLLLISFAAALLRYILFWVSPPGLGPTLPSMMVVPTIVILLVGLVAWFARHSAKRGWLR